MNFLDSIVSGFKNYFNFKDRAGRSEYWYWILFCMLTGFILGIADAAIFGPDTGVFSGLFNLATLVPSIAVATRRLHDIDRSGWWQLLYLTIIGIIPLLYWFCQKGQDQENRFGQIPVTQLPKPEVL